jgi:hypothetical protein
VPQTPRDITDLFLAPVALQVDHRLEELARLDRDELHKRVVLDSNNETWERDRRARDVVETVTYLLDLHGWTAAWDDRGIRLSHGHHTLVLGVPGTLRAYVDELSG